MRPRPDPAPAPACCARRRAATWRRRRRRVVRGLGVMADVRGPRSAGAGGASHGGGASGPRHAGCTTPRGEYNEYSTANRENLLFVADCCNPDPAHNAQMDAMIAESLELYNIQIELERSALLPAPPYGH